jgi:CxxH/CxxC protein (TIGR04129 family)
VDYKVIHKIKGVLWMELIKACQEHIEEALDDAVYGGFELPILKAFLPVDKLNDKCAYCEATPIYVVENGHSHTI